MAYIDQNAEFYSDADIKAVEGAINAIKSGTEEAAIDYAKILTKAHEDVKRRDAAFSENLAARVAELQEQGALKTQTQVAKYIKAQEDERQAQKLQSEISILKTISKHGQEELDKKNASLEAEAKYWNDKVDTELEIKRLENSSRKSDKKLLAEKRKQLEDIEKSEKKRRKEEKKQSRKERAQEKADDYTFGDLFADRFEEFSVALANPVNEIARTTEKNLLNTLTGIGKAIENGVNEINNAISSYAKYQGSINAGLQGISSFPEVVDNLSAVAYSPLLKAEDLYSNVAELVGQGIATNIEQRAMFATVKDSIASTFDVTNDSLKRIIRIQQTDSTAARLGMEAYLTEFLNRYVENTEYLHTTFDAVSSSLLEASSMMYLSSKTDGAAKSAELEFVVQKWLGTLSGVGLSDTAAQSIANAIGQIGSGDVDSISGSDIQNLMVMAASKAGLSYGEMLNTGLDANDANNLMLGVVKYLKEIGETGTNVVKNQLAKIFGVTVSDLVAVSNLSNDALNQVHKDLLSYNNMYGELNNQFKELPDRLGIANILENAFANFTYQTGMDIASNPALYATWKITDLISSVTGGINLPFISAFGNGFDLNTTLENLIKLTLVGISTFGGIGKIVGGLASVGDGSILLRSLEVSEGSDKISTFGQSSMKNGKRQSGETTSQNTIVGNTSGEDYANAATNTAEDDAQKKLDQKIEEYEKEDPVVTYLDKEVQLAERLSQTQMAVNLMFEVLQQQANPAAIKSWQLGLTTDEYIKTLSSEKADLADTMATFIGSVRGLELEDFARIFDLVNSNGYNITDAIDTVLNESGKAYGELKTKDAFYTEEVGGIAGLLGQIQSVSGAATDYDTVLTAFTANADATTSAMAEIQTAAKKEYEEYIKSLSNQSESKGGSGNDKDSVERDTKDTRGGSGGGAGGGSGGGVGSNAGSGGNTGGNTGSSAGSSGNQLTDLEALKTLMNETFMWDDEAKTSGILSAIKPIADTISNIDATINQISTTINARSQISGMTDIAGNGSEEFYAGIIKFLEANLETATSIYTAHVGDISHILQTTYSTIATELVATTIAPAIQDQITTNLPQLVVDTITNSMDAYYDKFLEETGAINNILSTETASKSDVSDYLIEIDFATGFKLIVENVAQIRSIIEDFEPASANIPTSSGIAGFTSYNSPINYTFNK